MASFTLGASALFPVGTTVYVYSGQHFSGASPSGSPVTSGVTQADSTTTFTGLADDTPYVAGAQISGSWRKVAFRTEPVAESGGVGPEGPAGPTGPAGPAGSASDAYALPSSWDKGLDFQAYNPGDYADADAQAALDAAIDELGITAIALWREYRMASGTATTISTNTGSGGYTASDAAITSITNYAKGKGLKVFLRLVVNATGTAWRGNINPSIHATWFVNWSTIVNANATLAQSLGIDMMDVGSELKTLTVSGNTSSWQSVIAGARGIYTGHLTYGGSYGFDSTAEYRQIGFWGDLDSIGIDAYFPFAEDNTALSEDDIVRRWGSFPQSVNLRTNSYINEIEQVAVQYGKNVRFHEVGYPNSEIALSNPPSTAGTTHDEVRATRAYGALMRAWAQADKPWFKGMYLWDWFAQDADGGAALTATGTQHTIAGKTSAARIKEWFTALNARPAPQPDEPPRVGLSGNWDAVELLGSAPSGGAVASWTDSSGYGRHLTQATAANRPTLVQDVLNGLPGVRFDGSNDYLDLAFFDTQPWTIFLVGRWRVAYAADTTMFDSAASFRGGLFRKSSTLLEAYAGTALQWTDTPETTHLWTVHFNGASSVVRTDRTQKAAGNAGSGGSTGTGLRLGASSGGAASQFGAVDIHQVLRYSGVLTASYRVQIENYLRTKWGTP